MRTVENRTREAQRDGMFTNAAEPAPTGSVSEARLTGLKHERLAAGGQAVLPPDLTRNVQAATLPPVAPGQARSAGDTSGVRNESSRFEHGKGAGSNGKNTPER